MVEMPLPISTNPSPEVVTGFVSDGNSILQFVVRAEMGQPSVWIGGNAMQKFRRMFSTPDDGDREGAVG